jgi:hypothetical protein
MMLRKGCPNFECTDDWAGQNVPSRESCIEGEERRLPVNPKHAVATGDVLIGFVY